MTRNRTSLRTRPLGTAAAVLAGLVLAAPSARAQVVTIEADLDATMYEDFGGGGNTGNGAGNFIFSGYTAGGDERRALLRFDVKDIPAGATINSATVTLNMNMTISGGQLVNLHRALAQWGEGASMPGGQEGAGTAAAPRDATWTQRLWPACPWSTDGGDYAAAASGSAVVGDISGTDYVFSGGGLAADVQSWIDGAQPNYGWLLRHDATSGTATAKRFASKDYPVAAERPRLTVDYTVGPGCGAVNYCGPAALNSDGCAARIWWSGSCTVADQNFTVTASDLPVGQFGYFIASRNQGFFMPGSSSGFVCLGANIARFNYPGGVIQGPSGSVTLDLNSFPVNPPSPVVPGDTWNFQCWYRDLGPTSNFSNGLQVTFD